MSKQFKVVTFRFKFVTFRKGHLMGEKIGSSQGSSDCADRVV